ncbi:aldo/keto reductase [Propionimicrobium sp. PCR01-08-3]|uniref:aldo/keto reductase n=1 Tax=Propionimicrobium sp. PCR01-08-3 TaxID=3052086 RepID=UPI00255C7DFC|nr:aldo/keto reductase [Propionimicrobium sp. PCR01-08-3]WIY82119.1 aldo/keto reductase [Propionimicrobium sp. PCR01-08-3]
MEQITIPTVPLLDGGSIPLVGTGTLFTKGNELANLLAECIKDGYRLLDTAAQYANEVAVGEAIRRSGVPRDEIFVTTKVAGVDQGRELTRHGLEDSLRKLNTDYVDMLLIHWPNPSRGLATETWQEMLELQSEGLVKHVGVSNFLPHQLEELYQASGVWPVVNQIQLSPALARTEVRAFLAERGIVAEAWRPLGNQEHAMDQIIVQTIAERHGVDVSQVVLRWAVQQGIVVIPASKNRERWHRNADLFGFELSDQEMTDLATVDLGEDKAWDANVHEEW